MEIQVLKGALVEVPMADVTGMDRRAFGELVGPRGELASYAFGWTTGSDPHVARLSIGIGAGNPGGRSTLSFSRTRRVTRSRSSTSRSSRFRKAART
ncbi:hypothetical protein AB0J77_30010 [Micromonospora tulbaghiae]|uniref:hypothetical protein n=1 Tax=Micromonospora tulbaghiae TaxID=479978 RepID=UPI003431540E